MNIDSQAVATEAAVEEEGKEEFHGVDIRPGAVNGFPFNHHEQNWRDENGNFQPHNDNGILNTQKSNEKSE